MAENTAGKIAVAVFISGSGTNMAALLYASKLADARYRIVLVASNDPAAGGLTLAAGENIPIFALTHKGMDRAAHDEAMESAAVKAGAQMIVLAGYMRILSDEFVRRWAGRMLNIHPSLLPKYRGLDTHGRALAGGDTKAGATVHLVSTELDAGEILGQIEVAVQPGDTGPKLAERVRLAEHQLYPRVLNDYVSRPFDAGYLLGRLREIALALPEVEERDSHGAPGWRTGGKSGRYFAYLSDRHHGEPHIALLARTSGTDEMAELIARDPDTFFRPAYYGASGWIGVILNRAGVDWDQVEYWVQRSWRSAAPKRLTISARAAEDC